MIEQRHACFQGSGHTHAIYFGQDIARQIRLAVDVKQRIKNRLCFDAGAKFSKRCFDVTVVAKLTLELAAIKRPLVESCEHRNRVEIAVDRIERHVVEIVAAPKAVRQSLADWFHHSASYNSRQQRIPAPSTLGHVTSVTGKQLVTAIAREHDRHVVARQLRNHVGWDGGGISERLVKMPCQLIDDAANLGSNKELMVIGPKLLRRQPRVLELVVAVLVKANREGLDGLPHLMGHQRYYGARIDAPREEGAQGNV